MEAEIGVSSSNVLSPAIMSRICWIRNRLRKKPEKRKEKNVILSVEPETRTAPLGFVSRAQYQRCGNGSMGLFQLFVWLTWRQHQTRALVKRPVVPELK